MARTLDHKATSIRDIEKEKAKALKNIKETVRLTSQQVEGQYYSGCKCREYQVTDDPKVARQFMIDHISC